MPKPAGTWSGGAVIAPAPRVEAGELAGMLVDNSVEGACANNTGFRAYFDKAGRFGERTLGNPPAAVRTSAGTGSPCRYRGQ
jgi:hypothetical protein